MSIFFVNQVQSKFFLFSNHVIWPFICIQFSTCIMSSELFIVITKFLIILDAQKLKLSVDVKAFYILFCVFVHLSEGGGSLFAIHGDCEAYDTRTDRWHMVASMSTRRARVGVAAIGNRLYAVGG